MKIPSMTKKQTEEGEGFPGVGDSIREDQRVPALENLFHQVPHGALEEFTLCCLWTIHLKKVQGRRGLCVNQHILYNNSQKKKHPRRVPTYFH